MADPDISQIKKELTTRCQSISQAGGFYTDLGLDVRRAPIDLDNNDVPVVGIYEAEINAEDRQAKSQHVSTIINIEAHKKIETANPEDEADQMKADIYRAVEKTVTPVEVRAAVIKTPPEYVTDVTEYPKGVERIVSVIVQYKITYRRNYGNPTN